MMVRTPVDLLATTRDVKLHIRRVIGELEAIEQQQDRFLGGPETCSSTCISQLINLTRRLLGCAVHGGRDSSESRPRECHPLFRPVSVQLKGFASEVQIAGPAACNLSHQKAADARIMAECARVAKDVVFVAADDSQAVITAEMRELTPRRSIYWPTGRDDEA